MQQADEGNIDQILAFAVEVIPLQQIGTGPARALGLGREFRAHTCLQFVIQRLVKFPGRGWPLIKASLQSPVVRGRNAAINATAEWDRTNWTKDMEEAFQRALEFEPNEEVQVRLGKLLRGEALDSDNA